MKNILLTTLIFISSFIFAKDDFQFKSNVNINKEISETELIKLDIPQNLYPAIRTDLRDIRLFDSAKRSIPFSIEQDRTEKRESYKSYYNASVEALKLSDESITATIGSSEKQLISGVRIKTPLNNFEFSVSIYNKGELLVKDATLYDYSSFTESRKETVSFSPIMTDSLKIIIKGLDKLQKQKLFQLKKLTDKDGETSKEELIHISQRHPKFSFQFGEHRISKNIELLSEVVDSKLVDWKVTNSKDKTVIRISTNKLPINTITIKAAEQNFSRPISIKSVAAKPHQRQLYYGELSKWNYRKFQKDQTTIKFHNPHYQELELTIFNKNETALTVTDINFTIPQKCLYFLGEPQKHYTLRYGNEDLKANQSRLPEAVLNQGRSKAIKAKIEINKPAQQTRKKQEINSNYIIIPIIVLIITFLIWSISSTLKKVE